MAPRKLHKGAAIGILAGLSPISLVVFSPVALMSVIAFFKSRRAHSKYQVILFAIILLKITWMCLIATTIGQLTLYDNLRIFMPDLLLLAFTLVRADRKHVRAFSKVVYALFLLDLLFNLSIIVFGVDPLGRGGSLRPGDLSPRVGGVFGHPFTSVQITVSAALAAVALRKKGLVALSVLGFLANGTFKSPLALVILIGMYVVMKIWPRTWLFVSTALAFATVVVIATFMTASSDGFVNGNALRVAAWTNAIQNVIEHPLLGKHDFAIGTFEGMSTEILKEFGIAESPYLQLWVDFGFAAPLLTLTFFYYVLTNSVSRFRRSPRDPIAQAATLSAAFVFCDYFYGTYFGTVLTTTSYAMMCISYDRAPQRQKDHSHGLA